MSLMNPASVDIGPSIEEGRDAIGRFAKGNQISKGYGRPSKQSEGAYLKALLDAVPPEVFAELVQAIAGQAADGDVPAFKVIAEYAIGKPMQHVEAQGSTHPLTMEEWEAQARERRAQVEQLEDD